MPKYSEANVITIKKDLQDISTQIGVAQKKLEAKQKESAQLDADILRKRKTILELGEQPEYHLSKYASLIKQMKSDIAKYSAHQERLLEGIRILKEGLKDINQIPEKQTFFFVNQVIDSLRTTLSFLDSQAKMKEQEVADLDARKAESEELNKELESQRADIQKNIQELTIELGLTDAKKKHALELLIDAHKQIEHIEIRDHDSMVMQQRLSPEYQAAYKQIPHR